MASDWHIMNWGTQRAVHVLLSNSSRPLSQKASDLTRLLQVVHPGVSRGTGASAGDFVPQVVTHHPPVGRHNTEAAWSGCVLYVHGGDDGLYRRVHLWVGRWDGFLAG